MRRNEFLAPHRAYLLASTLLGPIARPILNRRLARGKEDPVRITERLGQASLPRPKGTLVWMHGASVGEAMSMLPLIHAMLAARDDIRVLVTTGTVTSAQRLTGLLPERTVHQFAPVDTRSAVRGFLDHWKPDLAIWVESELWPRLVTDTAARDIPMALINARFSQKSIQGWYRAQGMLRNLLGCFHLIRTQDSETQGRLGPYAPTAKYAGNLKALIETPECDHETFQSLQKATGDRPIWLAASTHAEDEPQVLAAQRLLKACGAEDALLVLAPRHPERSVDIARKISDAGLSAAIRSRGEVPTRDIDVWLADTIGEMGLWYRLAPVTFVGGSFGLAGGHTPFEPILLDSAVLHGPNVANFAPSYRALTAAEAAYTVNSTSDLASAVERLLTDQSAFQKMVEAARQSHQQLMPNINGMVQELLTLLEPAS